MHSHHHQKFLAKLMGLIKMSKQTDLKVEMLALAAAISEGNERGETFRQRGVTARSVCRTVEATDAFHLDIAASLMLAFIDKRGTPPAKGTAEAKAHSVAQRNEVRNPLRYLNAARDDLRADGKLPTATGEGTHGNVVPSVKPENHGATWRALAEKKTPDYLALAVTAVGKITKGRNEKGINQILAAMVAAGFKVEDINSLSAVEV